MTILRGKTKSPIASFFVPGIPQPGGSKRGFVNPKTGRIVILEDAKGNKDWRISVVAAALEAYTGDPVGGSLELGVEFRMPRPKGHYGTGRNAGQIRSSAPVFPTTRPDLTKLWRSTEDALTGILWRDDAQIICQHVRKVFSKQTGACITVWAM